MFPVNINPEHPCHYCIRIAEKEHEHLTRRGMFTVDNPIRRCTLHAQLRCDRCTKFRHFSDLYHCRTEGTICFRCSKPRMHRVLFWDRIYAF